LDRDVRVHRVDDDRVFLSNIEKSSAPLGRRPRSRGASAVRLADGMLERRLDGSLRRSRTRQSLHNPPKRWCTRWVSICQPPPVKHASKSTPRRLRCTTFVSDSNCMVQ